MRTAIYSCFIAILTVFWVSGATPVQAATCGGTYTVKRGDTLSRIANELYRNAAMWKVIQSSNVTVIGDSPNALRSGMRLTIPCIDGLPTGLEGGTETASLPTASTLLAIPPGTAGARSGINLITAGDYAPFSDQGQPNGGMMTEVVAAAMSQAAPEIGFAIHWVEGREAHLDPLLSNALLDMGFPWAKPDCASIPEHDLCTSFLFSDPMFEMLLTLFTATDTPLMYETDSDLHGKTLCRPAGYALHQLDGPDRRWLSEDLITLKQPRRVAECFAMLVAGEVDAVVLNEFTGRAAIREMGLSDQVDLDPRPLAIESLHVVIHKAHPQAQAMLITINTGLRAIRANGTYQRIIDSHLSRIWAEY